MKSIKEKAEEYVREFVEPFVYYTKDKGRQFEPLHEDSFEEGANYVLDEIESILEDKELDVEETYNKIYTTINQLKK